MNSQNERAAKRSRLFLWISIFVVVPFSLLAVVILLWIGREVSGSSRLKARIATLKKQGYPTDDASLEAQYKAGTDPTNTDAWLELIDTLKSSDFVASSKGIPYLSLDAEVPVEPIEEWVEEKASLVFLEKWKTLYADVLLLSIDAKPVRFPIVFDSYRTLLPQTEKMRQFARLLQLRGRVALRSRDSASEREVIDGLLGLSRVNSAEPNLVSQLVSHAIDGVALELLKESLQRDAINESDLRTLLPKVMAWINIGTEWSSSIAGELALSLPVFTDSKKAKAMGVVSIPGRARDAFFYIETSQRVLEIPTDRLDKIQAEMNSLQIEQEMKGGWIKTFDTLLTNQLMPDYAAAVNAMIRRALQHRMAAVAIGIRLYEDGHSKLPDSLGDLSEVNVDTIQLGPTEERSFGYQRNGTSAKLWGGSSQDLFSIPSEPHSPTAKPSAPALQADNDLWLWNLLPQVR